MNRSIAWLALLLLTMVGSASGHGEKHRESNHTESKSLTSPQMETYAQINQAFLHDVKPIVDKKCYDCHGSGHKLPWYASVPIIKQLIEWDIAEAKEHLDMSDDYPFKGHGDKLEDMESLIETIHYGSMPPIWYSLFHWDSRLSDGDEKKIIHWAQTSLKELKKVE